MDVLVPVVNCFRSQRYKILKPIHNTFLIASIVIITVSDHKDTKFWNQFTTTLHPPIEVWKLFQITKIQNFETNSQPGDFYLTPRWNCFRSQRYKILKPIHNFTEAVRKLLRLFQITKIQNFETNSQQMLFSKWVSGNCFRSQRYKILKPIHNLVCAFSF